MSLIVLPRIYQDHMMLQRDKILHICGFAAPEVSTVSICLDETQRSVPVRDGRFACDFPPQPAGRGRTLAFYADACAEPDLLFSDISIGDIWMACGQSNMEYFLRYDAHWNDTKQAPRNPDIHMYNCPRIAYEGQQRKLEHDGFWFQEGAEAWASFSAPGYSFARTVSAELQIPVGIIGCNWGGTPACAWMDEAHLNQPPLDVFLREYEDEVSALSPERMEELSMKAWKFEDSYQHGIEWHAMMHGLSAKEQAVWMRKHAKDPALPLGPYHHYRPCGLFHTMIETIAPFSVKGFLWYQGESDSGHAEIYDQTMEALIDCFRTVWKDDSLPFLFVQLAPFGKWLDCDSANYAIVRERQERVSKTVPGTAMVSIMDLGNYDDIHPKYKMEVGQRLGLLALGKVYGKQLLCESPEFLSASRDGRTIRIDFLHAEGGLHAVTKVPDAFRIEGCTIQSITLPDSPSLLLTLKENPTGPLHISYAEEDYCEVRIWNKAGLPIKPFHCDI